MLKKKGLFIIMFIAMMLCEVNVCKAATEDETEVSIYDMYCDKIIETLSLDRSTEFLLDLESKGIYYSFSTDAKRVSKKVGDDIVYYEYDISGRIVKEMYEENEIIYQYSSEGYLSSIEYNGVKYFAECDEQGTVLRLRDIEGRQIVQYTYINGVVVKFDVCEYSECDSMIGSINKIRLYSMYYDDETGLYYTGGRFWDANEEVFVDKISAESYMPSFQLRMRDSISAMASEITQWAEYLLNVDESYGKAVAAGTSWYSGMDEVEVIARLIYAENPYGNKIDQRAITWVVLNRYHNSGYPDTLLGVATQNQQFASIWGSGSWDARNPGYNYQAWYDATWLACAICTTTDKSECQSLFGKPNGITNQMYFRSLYQFTERCVDSSEAECIMFNGSNIKSVVVVGDQYNSISHLINATRVAQITTCVADCIGQEMNSSIPCVERFHNIYFNYGIPSN